VTYNDAPIGIFKNAGDASRFACDVARMQAQIGRVTWVIVVAEVEEVHRFETRLALIKHPGKKGRFKSWLHAIHVPAPPREDTPEPTSIPGRARRQWP
jgi:hypothetical protein